jgi:hypothetical protein
LNDETFNISLRKFLKMVGVSSQREIEQAVGPGACGRLHIRQRNHACHHDAADRRIEALSDIRWKIELE